MKLCELILIRVNINNNSYDKCFIIARPFSNKTFIKHRTLQKIINLNFLMNFMIVFFSRSLPKLSKKANAFFDWK